MTWHSPRPNLTSAFRTRPIDNAVYFDRIQIYKSDLVPRICPINTTWSSNSTELLEQLWANSGKTAVMLVHLKSWMCSSCVISCMANLFPALGGGPKVVVSTAACHARVLGSFLPYLLIKLSIMESLRDRAVACSTSDLQGLNFKSCV